MRGILVDWIIEVHFKFKLRDETLFLCINIIDRFLSKKSIIRQKLQLVGVSSLLIACKYEEIYAPEVKDFVYVTDNAYTRTEVLEMESQIAYELNFDLLIHSPLFYLNRIMEITSACKEERCLNKYLIELSLCSYKMLKYCPLTIACAVYFFTRKLLSKDCFPVEVQRFSELSEADVRQCAKDLCLILVNVSCSSFKAVRKKFSTDEFLNVSNIQLERRSQH